MLTLNAELWQSRLKINDDATFDRILQVEYYCWLEREEKEARAPAHFVNALGDFPRNLENPQSKKGERKEG